MAKIEFKPAQRKSVKIKLALAGPSGSGKTYSALKLAQGLVGPKGRIAVVDTENDSAQLYADVDGMPAYDTVTMGPPFLSDKYSMAIKAAVEAGFDALIIDSASHQWNGDGGIMDRIDKEKMAKPGLNTYTLWAKYTPEHERFKSAIVQSPIHIIVTLRSKQEYVLQENEKGKATPKKVGMAPVQRDQFEYEFTTVFDLSMEHYASVSKDRTNLFDGQNFKITEETGQAIIEWLKGGKVGTEQGVSGQLVRANSEGTAPKNDTANTATSPTTARPSNGTQVQPTTQHDPAKTSPSTVVSLPENPPLRNETPITMTDVGQLYDLAYIRRAWNKRELDNQLQQHYKVESAMKLKKWQYDEIVDVLETRG